MVDFIIAGHGRFASGIKSGVEMIFGPMDMLDTVEFLSGETKTELDAKMADALERHESARGIIVFCDLLQGSPFQSAATHAQEDPRIRVVYGANPAMVIECLVVASSEVGLDVDFLANRAVGTGKALMGVFRGAAEPNANQDEDW